MSGTTTLRSSGEVKTFGTEINELMPPVSRFGGGNRAQKKRAVMEKIRRFFEKCFGIGEAPNFSGN